MTYNTTIGTGIWDFFLSASVNTGGMFGLVMMMTIFLVFFGYFMTRYSFVKSLPVASFVCFILSILFYQISDGAGNHFVGESVIMFFFAVMGLSVLMLLGSSKN